MRGNYDRRCHQGLEGAGRALCKKGAGRFEVCDGVRSVMPSCHRLLPYYPQTPPLTLSPARTVTRRARSRADRLQHGRPWQ